MRSSKFSVLGVNLVPQIQIIIFIVDTVKVRCQEHQLLLPFEAPDCRMMMMKSFCKGLQLLAAEFLINGSLPLFYNLSSGIENEA